MRSSAESLSRRCAHIRANHQIISLHALGCLSHFLSAASLRPRALPPNSRPTRRGPNHDPVVRTQPKVGESAGTHAAIVPAAIDEAVFQAGSSTRDAGPRGKERPLLPGGERRGAPVFRWVHARMRHTSVFSVPRLPCHAAAEGEGGMP